MPTRALTESSKVASCSPPRRPRSDRRSPRPRRSRGGSRHRSRPRRRCRRRCCRAGRYRCPSSGRCSRRGPRGRPCALPAGVAESRWPTRRRRRRTRLDRRAGARRSSHHSRHAHRAHRRGAHLGLLRIRLRRPLRVGRRECPGPAHSRLRSDRRSAQCPRAPVPAPLDPPIAASPRRPRGRVELSSEVEPSRCVEPSEPSGVAAARYGWGGGASPLSIVRHSRSTDAHAWSTMSEYESMLWQMKCGPIPSASWSVVAAFATAFRGR